MFEKKKPILLKQHDITDCGPTCIASISNFYGKHVLISEARDLCSVDRRGASMFSLLKAAEKLGFKSEGVKGDCVSQFANVTLPAVAHVIIEEKLEHYVVVYEITDKAIKIMDPAIGEFKSYSYRDFQEIWKSGAVLLMEPGEKFEKNDSRFIDKKTWLKNLVLPETRYIYQGIFLGLLVAVLGISTSIFIQKLIDDIIPNKKTELLMIGTILIILILIAKAIFNYLKQTFLLRMAKNLNINLINSFYSILLHLKKSFFDTRKTGEFIARMNDSIKIQQSILRIINSVSIDIVMVIVTLTYIFIIDLKIALFSITLIPIFIFIVWKYMKEIKQANREVMSNYALVESNYIDHITGIDTIKAYGKENVFDLINRNYFEQFQFSILRLGKIDIKVSTIAEVITGIFLINTLSISAYFSIESDFSPGHIMGIFTVLGALVPSIIRISLINLSVQEAFISFERLYEFIVSRPERITENKKSVLKHFKSLELRHINFTYQGRKQVLKNINLLIKKDETVALVGESGSGKSSLVMLIEAFYEADSGTILWNHIDSKTLSVREIRDKIAYVPQETKIFNGTVLDNILLGEECDIKDVENFCNKVNLMNFINTLPQGLLTLVGEEGINLSGGQKQLIILIRALYKKPQLLILDEATSAMDMETESIIYSVLSQITTTKLIIAHRISSIIHADRIYVMKNGKILEEGKHCDLIINPNSYYKKLYDFQNGNIIKFGS